MKKYIALFVFFLYIQGLLSQNIREQNKESLSDILLSWNLVKTDSFNMNIDKYIPKLRCCNPIGHRVYTELINDTLSIPLMGHQIIKAYNPQIFDVRKLYLCDGNYFKYSYVYKDVYNIFFAKVDNRVFLIGLLFYNNKWHVNCYDPHAPFFWKIGTRVNY